jgi:hypothetical protein
VGDDDEVGSLADRIDHRIGVVPQPCGLVVCGEVDGDHIVAALAQLGRDQVPAPGTVTTGVDRNEGERHGFSSCHVPSRRCR